MKKIYLKRLFQVSGFLILFLFLLGKANQLTNSVMLSSQPVPTFYQQKKNTIDVVTLGSSHAYRSFSPMELWEKTGITGFSLCTTQQTTPGAYYLLKEAIRTQHPKVVFFELYSAILDDHYRDLRLHYVIDHMQWGKAKKEMVTDFMMRKMTLEECMPYLFPFLQYHSRWNQLNLSPAYPFLKGYGPCSAKKTLKAPQPVTLRCENEIEAVTQEYLDKIIELCEEENIELVFYKTPLADGKQYEEAVKKLNSLKDFLAERDCVVLDFCEMAEEIKINYQKDFYNTTHLNTRGCKKIMKYLCSFLTEQYDLPDHREDPTYASWNEDLEKYHKLLEEGKDFVIEAV